MCRWTLGRMVHRTQIRRPKLQLPIARVGASSEGLLELVVGSRARALEAWILALPVLRANDGLRCAGSGSLKSKTLQNVPCVPSPSTQTDTNQSKAVMSFSQAATERSNRRDFSLWQDEMLEEVAQFCSTVL